MNAMWLIIIHLMLTVHQYAHGANVLLVLSNRYSPCNKVASIGDGLVKLGHRVHAYAPTNTGSVVRCLKERNFTVTSFKGLPDGEQQYFMDIVFKIIQEQNLMELIYKCRQWVDSWASKYLDSENLEKLRQMNFDMAVLESFQTERFVYLIPYNLGIPFVSVSAFMYWTDTGNYYTPYDESGLIHSDPMVSDIFGRMYYAFMSLVETVVMPMLSLTKSQTSFIGGLSILEYGAIVRKSVLFVEDVDVIVARPTPFTPNTVRTGGFSVRDSKPLPPHLGTICDGASEGVIYVSFGSSFTDNSTGTGLPKILRAVFSKIQQTVVIKSSNDYILGNVHNADWIPQNDILGHKNTKLFISHCGRNSFFGAVYHIVPIICIPFMLDQPSVARRVSYYGIGFNLDPNTLTEEELSDAVHTILHNDTFRRNIERVSSIYRELHPEPASTAAARAVNHVVRYGGDHLRPASLDMNLVQRMSLDILTGLFCILGLFVLFSAILIRYMCSIIRRRYKLKHD